MNSDPYESAAWRTFGLMDSDEATAFDEASRNDPALKNACLEMDHLTAAIAVNLTKPVTPRAGQLERLHLRLGLSPIPHRNWLAISGWATAACLAGLLAVNRGALPFSAVTENTTSPSTMHPAIPDGQIANANTPESVGNPTIHDNVPAHETPPSTDGTSDGKAYVKVETKRLIQEIEILRDKLENFQKQDRKRFEPTPGLAWPVVMRMTPPGSSGDIENGFVSTTEEPPIVAVLGDALTQFAQPPSMANLSVARTNQLASVKSDASAMPIYDAARDAGTLVVSNLPAKTAEEQFNLWVVTKTGENPVYVGRLPESANLGTESFDFSLGSTAIVPSGFLLTKDSAGDPVTPSKTNTILLGPK